MTVPASNHSATPFAARRGGPLKGQIAMPGDKSISHRALILGGLAVGETAISGLLEGEDVLRTAAAMRALGASVTREGAGLWRVAGAGVGGLVEPADMLDLGNSGTGARLLMGAVAPQHMTAFFTGDASLRRRPMGRVLAPLREMGAEAVCRAGERLPLALTGGTLLPISYRLNVASAQVKSAILLAGLGTVGRTTVLCAEETRDHTERMLRHFGAAVETARAADGLFAVSITGMPELRGQPIAVPGDPSSAAFPMVAALLSPGSDITITGVGLNPLRIGLFETLREMGADLSGANAREEGGEPVGDLRVRASALRGIEVPAARAPSMIDEYPVLAVAAACAEGRTVMRGLSELRVKESDRLSAIAAGLVACGVRAAIEGDDLIVEGQGDGARVAGGASIVTHMDHRIAMAFLVLGLASAAPITIDDAAMIDTSFPGFAELMCGLGADIRVVA
jgi:3-phosphoshikimate 1-carboxyvinyltransferase